MTNIAQFPHRIPDTRPCDTEPAEMGMRVPTLRRPRLWHRRRPVMAPAFGKGARGDCIRRVTALHMHWATVGRYNALDNGPAPEEETVSPGRWLATTLYRGSLIALFGWLTWHAVLAVVTR